MAVEAILYDYMPVFPLRLGGAGCLLSVSTRPRTLRCGTRRLEVRGLQVEDTNLVIGLGQHMTWPGFQQKSISGKILLYRSN